MSPATTVLERAAADLERGEPWRARDRLGSAWANRPGDLEVAETLGDVLFSMGDLPAAGRWWWLSAVDDERHRAARSAFAARHGDDAEKIARHLPRLPSGADLDPGVRARLDAIGWTPALRPPPRAASEPTVGDRVGEAAGTVGCLALLGVWALGAIDVVRRVARHRAASRRRR